MQDLCAYAVNAKMITLFGMCKFMHYANLHDFGCGMSIFGIQNQIHLCIRLKESFRTF